MKLLALDTATENCSAALWISGTVLQREVEAERGHAGLILNMIDELLAEAELKLAGLDAIAFGRGPGSFTGVRLAASVTQGLAFGADLPVVPISDLRAVAQRMVARSNGEIPSVHVANANANAPQHVLVCNDARMQEVYWCCFIQGSDGLVTPVDMERVSKPTDVNLPEGWRGQTVSAAGRGFAAYTDLRTRLESDLTYIDDRMLPRAKEIVELAVPEVEAGRTVIAEEALPVYLRNDVARPQVPPAVGK